MNIADYFKGKPETPIEALIDELENNHVPITLAKRPVDMTDSEVLIDRILAPHSGDELQLPA